MGQAAYIHGSRIAVESHIGRINAADRTSAVLEAVRRYLGSWPAERVERLQRADAGWAPFDAQQQPLEVHSAADVEDVFRDVHQHCAALRESGLEMPLELIELDWVLLFAHQRLREAAVGPSRMEDCGAG